MDSKIFRYSGVGSKAWYISRIKIGENGRTGFTYLRGDSVADGKALSFDEIKSSMSQLVAAGYVKRNSKPDAPRSDKYEVTSFGHRYLEEHKDELEIKDEPTPKGAAPTGVMHEVPKIEPFTPSPLSKPDSAQSLGRVVDAAIDVGREIEKHKAAKPISTPDPEISPLQEQRSNTPHGPENDKPEEISPLENTNNLAHDVKEKLKDLLLEKFLDKSLKKVLSFDSISIHDFLEYVERDDG